MKKLFFLAAIACLFTLGNACSNSSAKSDQTASASVEVKDAKGTLAVEGSCGMCKKRIEKAATGIEGVTAATWDAEAKKLEFQYDANKTSPEAISKAVANVGYDTEKDKATDEVYEALPGCCKYRT
jgi:Cu(I)/Ag(I) efflux system membrane fusion protein